MRLLKQRKRNRVDRRLALEAVPTLHPGVTLKQGQDGNVHVSMTIKRGQGFFERMRPAQSERSYELDAFGTFVIQQVDGKKTVLDVINRFEQKFKLSRRETELSVVAFFKLLMQRHVLSVVVPRTKPRPTSAVALLLLAGALLLPGAATAQPHGGHTNVFAALQELHSRYGVRLPGSPGNMALQADVGQRFRDSGFTAGEMPFAVPVFEPGSVTLDLGDDTSFTLEAMHPTLMRPGNFTQSAFSSRLVYLGRGTPDDLQRAQGVSLDDAIAVMEYDCNRTWMNMSRFGVKGYIFLSPDGDVSLSQHQDKVFNTEVSVPRFYIDGRDAGRLRDQVTRQDETAVEVTATPSRWTQSELRNHWVLIPGADDILQENVIVLVAPLDANSVVPSRAYGAQRAINLQIMLSLLEDFKTKRPAHSVLLVAVNAHTQYYHGERQLAWHLMAPETDIEAMRDQIAGEMRLARLINTEYAKLQLGRVPDPAKADLHIMLSVMWAFDDMQSAERESTYRAALAERERGLAEAREAGTETEALLALEMPRRDEVLDLSALTESDLREAIAMARETMLVEYHTFFSRMSSNAGALKAEEKEDTAYFDALQQMSCEQIMAKLHQVKSVFDDEKLFEKWRRDLDASTRRRVYVKTELQDAFKARVNKTLQEIMILANPENTDLSEPDRKARIAELQAHLDDLRKVLVLFNKIDIGVGRSKTQYRQIAVNDKQRKLLRAETKRLVERFTRWEKQHEATLRRDTACRAVLEAMGRRKVALALLLNIDAHGTRIGLSYAAPRTKPGWFSGFSTFCEQHAEQVSSNQLDQTRTYVNALTGPGAHPSEHYFEIPQSAVQFFHAAQKTPAFAVKSAFTDAGTLFGPADTFDRLDPKSIEHLHRWTREWLHALLNDPDFAAPTHLLPVSTPLQIWSAQLRTYALEQFTGKPIPTRPVTDCFVIMHESDSGAMVPTPIFAGDVMHARIAISDDTANAYFYGMSVQRQMAPLAYGMDPECREVLWTIDKGRVQSSRQINSNVQRSPRATLPMFECREYVIHDRRDPSLLSFSPVTIDGIWPKEAGGKSDPEKYGVHGARTLSPARSHAAIGPIGIYLDRSRPGLQDDRLMVITEDKRCILNSTTNAPGGIGFADQEALGSDILKHASHDMALLNTSRQREMKGVVNQLLDELSTRGDALYEHAIERWHRNDHMGYVRHLYGSLGSHVKAYNEIAKMNADMLKAIVIYMALLLPFCYFMQRLIFNFKKLEHELLGFSLLFISMFVLFRFIHPAFRMAMSPEAIFIAFVLGAIGLFTTGVLRSRFHEEMSILFRGVAGIGEEVGHGTVGSTATMIGLQNMRRRKVRTSLTTATIVLVVFTMLAFSSVSRKAKPTLIAKADRAPYTGLFYHWPNGAVMDESSFEILRDLFADRADIRVTRMLDREVPWRLESVDHPENHINVDAISGLPAQDHVMRDSLSRIHGAPFSSDHAEEIMISQAAADALGLSREDVGRARLRILGREWLLQGLIDDQRYRLAHDLNPNLPRLPLGKLPGQGDNTRDEGQLDLEIANVTEQLIDPSAMAVIPEGMAQALGAKPRSVSIQFRNEHAGLDLGAEMRRALEATDAKFYLGSREPFNLDEESIVPIKAGVYYVGSNYRTAIGGMAKLIVPLLIAGSIILNTMLGTVYERRSEITIYNAIGLNPTHIFMFFLAEAFVYSFIGAVGGYLIGQILTIVLQAAGLITDVNINFSSLMVVYAIMFTMALVLLSTLYPGYVATRAAVPSGKRKWTLPAHDGQTMKVILPFIYAERLAYGVLAYIHEFFAPMTDQSTGDMVAALDSTQVGSDDNGLPTLSLRYMLALAPYDLGVTQYVTFTTQFDEEVDSFRLHMRMDRISGRDQNWESVNKPYLERIRKFLIRWRNIDPTRQNWYVNEARRMYGLDPEVRTQADAVASGEPSDDAGATETT